jgi:hypothetical protein
LKANHRSPISAGREKGRNLSRSVVIRQLVEGLQICNDVRCHRVFHWAICGVSSVLLCTCRCSGGGEGIAEASRGPAKLPMQAMENGRALKSEIGQRLARYVVKFDCRSAFLCRTARVVSVPAGEKVNIKVGMCYQWGISLNRETCMQESRIGPYAVHSIKKCASHAGQVILRCYSMKCRK